MTARLRKRQPPKRLDSRLFNPDYRLGQLPRVQPKFVRFLPWVLVGTGVAGVIIAIAKRKEIGVAVKSVTDRAKWAKKVFDDVSAVLPGLDVKSRLLIVAHAAYETGWGGNSPARLANNIFNLTAESAWKGDVYRQANADVSYQPDVCKRLGRPMTRQKNGKLGCRIDQVWRKYPNYRAAIRDYWEFIGPNQNRGRYAPARAALERGDVAGFVRALAFPADGSHGYFDPAIADEYASTLSAVFNTVCKYLGVC